MDTTRIKIDYYAKQNRSMANLVEVLIDREAVRVGMEEEK